MEVYDVEISSWKAEQMEMFFHESFFVLKTARSLLLLCTGEAERFTNTRT